MSDRIGQRSAGGNSGNLPSDGDTFSQNPNINADEAGNEAELRLVVGSSDPGVGLHLQSPQEIVNPGVMFGTRPSTMQLQQSMNDDLQVVAMRSQATQFNAFSPPVIMGLARHEDMSIELHGTTYEINAFRPLIVMGIPVHEDIRIYVDSMSDEDFSDFEEELENEISGLTEETITELLKQRKYECVTCDSLSDAETCCICIDAYVHGEDIGALNCGHEFHTECIKKWLLIKNDCPMCKSKGLGV